MKTGEDFWSSREERCFDRVVAVAATPAFWIGRHVMRQHVPPDLSVVFEQLRVDMGDVEDPPLFPLHKLQTLKPGTEEPFDRMAALFRKLTLDELGQAEDLRAGRITTVGPRGVLPKDHHARRAKLWQLEQAGAEGTYPGISTRRDYILTNRKRGWISSYAIYSHTHPGAPHEAAIIANFDDEDARKASLKYNADILLRFGRMALGRRFR